MYYLQSEERRRKLFRCFFMALQALVGQVLIIEASRSHSFRHTTLGRTSLDEWSARRRDLSLTTHNTHIHSPVAITASERSQTHALVCTATGIRELSSNEIKYLSETFRPRNKSLYSCSSMLIKGVFCGTSDGGRLSDIWPSPNRY